jgi:hypothetical protein
MFQLPSPQQKSNRSAIAWALFSQSIWAPVFFIDVQDQMASKKNNYDLKSISRISGQTVPVLGSAEKNSNLASIDGSVISKSLVNKNSTGIILNSAASQSKDYHMDLISRSSNSSLQFPTSFTSATRPKSTIDTAFVIKPSSVNHPLTIQNLPTNSTLVPDLTKSLFSRSDLLGGSLTLNDLNEPVMPPIARAERAHWSRMGDPLGPIPQIWREPMRKALNSLVTNSLVVSGRSQSSPQTSLSVDTARIVHVPSAKVRREADVPLALQSDGTVDILNTPDDPAVVEEIKTWSSKQQLPAKGRITPAVVHLHPLAPGQQSGSHSQTVGSEAAAKVTEPPPTSPPPQLNPEPVSKQVSPPAHAAAAPAEQAAAVVAPEPISMSQTIDIKSAAERSTAGGQP